MTLNQTYTKIYQARLIALYSLLTVLTLLVAAFSNLFLITDELYYQSLGEQLSIEQITQYLNVQNKYELLSYLFLILISLLKFSAIALAIYTVTILFGIKVTFKNIFRIVILAEFIFLIPLFLKFAWFYFIQSNYTLEDLQFFYPLSLLNIFETGTVSQLWVYPLQLLNIFEVAYWFLLALGIKQLIQSDFDKSLKLVLSSYLPAMLIWVVFVMFLTVTFNPNI